MHTLLLLPLLWIVSFFVLTMTKNRKCCKRFFTNKAEVNFYAGLFAGLLMAYSVALPRDRSLFVTMLGSIILLQGPAIAERSWRKVMIAAQFMISAMIVGPFIYGGAFVINGRHSLPLTVWGECGICIGVPWYDDIPLGWQMRALISFALYWLWAGMGIIVLQKNVSNDGVYKRFFAAIISISVGILLALVLFRISWCAKVSGTFARPLYSESEFIFSLFVYGLLFAIVPCVVQNCYFRLLRNSRWLQKTE